MKINVNGETVELGDNATVADLVAQLDLAGQYVAVERNRCVIPRAMWPETTLAEGDVCEVVSLVGGG
ncbi:MAG: sulfur carrier protein ThiS [Thermoguttaceae bacterium]